MFSLLARSGLRAVFARPLPYAARVALPTRAFAVSAPASAAKDGASVGRPPKDSTATKAKATKSTTATKTTKTKAVSKTKAASKIKTASKTKAAPKRKAAPKAKPAPKPKKAKAVKPPKPAPLTAADRPPKGPPSAWILFCNKYRAGEPPITNLAEAAATTRRAAGVWAALSAHEKQAFLDEAVVLRERYVAARAEWERTVDPARLRLLNARRVKRGTTRVRLYVPPEARRPANSFARFMVEFQKDNKDVPRDGKRSMSAARTAAAAVAWRGMSASEKQPYIDAAHRDFATWREQQASTSKAGADKEGASAIASA